MRSKHKKKAIRSLIIAVLEFAYKDIKKKCFVAFLVKKKAHDTVSFV